jgi:adenylate kinase
MTAALEYMRRGDLVPDATVLEMVWERSGCLKCGGGFLLDGFPRTVPQAQALQAILKDKGVALDGVLSFELPTEDVVARASGRRICSKCQAVYHIKSLRPKVDGVCDHCGGALVQREDDKPETVRFRLETYEKSTAPLTEFYKKLGLLVPVAVGGFPEETYDRTIAALEERG